MSKVIEIDKISFSYEKHNIFKNFSLDIEENKITFLMGNNGCGKTTLLNIINNFLFVKEGTIKIKGENISEYSKRELSKIIAYVPQNINQNIDFLVKDYLVMGRMPYINFCGSPKLDDFKIVEKYAKQMNIENLFDKNFNQLSGGQKQIISITRALIQETPIIILDEPMSALDIGKQADFLLLLTQLNKMGKTIILTSHNPNHSLQIDSFVCLIHNRKILAYGKNKDVLNIDNIKTIYGDRVKIDKDTSNLIFDLKDTI